MKQVEATETSPITGTVSVPGKPNYTGNCLLRYLVAEDLEEQHSLHQVAIVTQVKQ